MLNNLLKIIVTDSSGVEHIFNEVAGECEHYLTIKDDNGHCSIFRRTFDGDKTETETTIVFINPRRVDVLYGAEDA